MVRVYASVVRHLVIVSGTAAVTLLVAGETGLLAQQRLGAGRRIAWNQAAASDAEIASLTFVLYVDGSPEPLRGASCARAAGAATYECTARLPPLAPGVHTLQVAAAKGVGAASFESAQSAPLFVSVAGGADRDRVAPGTGVPELLQVEATRPAQPPRGERGGLAVQQLASGLVDATDLAFGSEGLLLIAQRSGTVRVVEDDRLRPVAALEVEDVHRSTHGALLSIAVHPQFARNGHVYVVYASESSEGTLAYTLARFRYARGGLAERALLLDAVPAAADRLAASVRFGPDGKLYVAFGDVDARRDDLGSYNGKVLRLNPDGTTPRDQRSASPVYVAGLSAPKAMAWRAGGHDLWIVDASPEGTRLVQAPLAETGAYATVHELPAESATAASIAFYDGELIAGLRGDLLIPGADGSPLLRARAAPTRGAALMVDRFQLPDVVDVRVVGVSPSGEIYVSAGDTVLRVLPGR